MDQKEELSSRLSCDDTMPNEALLEGSTMIPFRGKRQSSFPTFGGYLNFILLQLLLVAVYTGVLFTLWENIFIQPHGPKLIYSMALEMILSRN